MGKTEDLYKGVLDNLHDGVYFVDRDRVITYWNKGAERITGYTRKEALGRSCRDGLLNHISAEGVQLCDDACPLAACMQDGEVRELDVFLHHADGHRIPVLLRAAPLRDARGRIVGAVESFSSEVGLQSARTELHKLRRSVDTDALTGVASRRYVASRLRGVIAEMENPLTARAGLLFVDVDDFKHFNDVYGHDAGDKALRMVARTLRSSLRDTDVLGRWGGEEFMAVLLDVGSLDTLEALAERSRLLVGLSDLKLGQEPVTITVSVGATLFRPGDSAESIVQRADRLMYQSKRDGKQIAISAVIGSPGRVPAGHLAHPSILRPRRAYRLHLRRSKGHDLSTQVRTPFRNMTSASWLNLGLAGLLLFYALYLGWQILLHMLCAQIGVDYCAYLAAAKVASAHGYASLYDPQLLQQAQRDLLTSLGNLAPIPLLPFLYLPAFVLPFQLLSGLGPGTGFAIWTAVNLIVLVLYLRFFLRRLGLQPAPVRLLLMLLACLPTFMNLLTGQMNVWLVLCTGEFMRAFLDRRCFQRGLMARRLAAQAPVVDLDRPAPVAAPGVEGACGTRQRRHCAGGLLRHSHRPRRIHRSAQALAGNRNGACECMGAGDDELAHAGHASIRHYEPGDRMGLRGNGYVRHAAGRRVCMAAAIQPRLAVIPRRAAGHTDRRAACSPGMLTFTWR